MATRLIGTDSEDPRLPDTVIEASDLTTTAYVDEQIAFILEVIGAGGPGTSEPTLTVEASHHLTVSDHVVLTTDSAGTFTLAPSNATHAHTAEHVVLLPDGPVELTIQSGAATFNPWIGLVDGSTATVTWYDSSDAVLTTGLSPIISRPADGIVRFKATDSGLPAMPDIDFLNLGFSSEQDSGDFSLPYTFNHPGQPVTNIAGMQLLTGMRKFMAANTPLATALNCTGMNNLEYVECFGANVTGVTLTGCTSMIRLCLESCSVTYIDFSPVKACLRDLRCANSHGIASVTFVSDGPMVQQYHYCVNNQVVAQHLPNSQLPAVREQWMNNTGVTLYDTPTSSAAISIDLSRNALHTTTLDNLLIGYASLGQSNGVLDCGHATCAPTSASDTARATLDSRGWSINMPLSSAIEGNGAAGTWTTPTHGPFVAADQTVNWGGREDSVWGVTAGVLTVENYAYGRVYMNPSSRVYQPTFFEVAVDQSYISPSGGDANNSWGLFVNADADGNGGCRVFFWWPSTNSGNANGVGFGPSNNYHQFVSHTPTRVASNPAGWGTAGTHKVGLYHAYDCAFITFDGVKVYRCQGTEIDLLGRGGYFGVAGDTGHVPRLYQTWGISTVTVP